MRHMGNGSSGFNRSWPPKGRARRTMLGVAGATAAAGTIMVLSAAGGSAVAGAAPASVTLCHATASTTNPYVVITVAPNSIKNRIFGVNGHATHLGPIFDPAGGKSQLTWGDIIPAFDWGNPVRHFGGLNITGLGGGILANGCRIVLQSSTPPQSTPPETTPVETTPVETTPVETSPVETTPVETTPVETTPVETTPVETTPVETTPVETTPVETTPVETTPVETTPVETSPVKTTVVDSPLVSTTPVSHDS